MEKIDYKGFFLDSERRSTKLIDKDEALKVLKFNSWNIDEWECSAELRQAGLQANDMAYQSIDGLPTIEHLEIPVGNLTYQDFYRLKAIPIDWIEGRIKNIEDTLLEMSYRMLIEDWREYNQRGDKQ